MILSTQNEARNFSADIKVNDTRICVKEQPWSHALFQDRLDKIISAKNPLRALEIYNISGEKSECLHRILSQDVQWNGLEKLVLKIKDCTFYENLDVQVINKLLEIIPNLTRIVIDLQDIDFKDIKKDISRRYRA